MSGMYPSYLRSMTRVVRGVHAVSAAVLTFYLLPHIVNHVVALPAGAFYRVTIPPEYRRMPPPAPCGAPAADADAQPDCPKAT
jgi:hypothetical protein